MAIIPYLQPNVFSLKFDDPLLRFMPFTCALHIKNRDGSDITKRIDVSQAAVTLESLPPDQNATSPAMRNPAEKLRNDIPMRLRPQS